MQTATETGSARLASRLVTLEGERDSAHALLIAAEKALDRGDGSADGVVSAQASLDAVERAISRVAGEREMAEREERAERERVDRAALVSGMRVRAAKARAVLDDFYRALEELNADVTARLAALGDLAQLHQRERKAFGAGLASLHPEHSPSAAGGIDPRVADQLAALGMDVDAVAYPPVAGRARVQVPQPFGPMLLRAVEAARAARDGHPVRAVNLPTGEPCDDAAGRLLERLALASGGR